MLSPSCAALSRFSNLIKRVEQTLGLPWLLGPVWPGLHGGVGDPKDRRASPWSLCFSPSSFPGALILGLPPASEHPTDEDECWVKCGSVSFISVCRHHGIGWWAPDWQICAQCPRHSSFGLAPALQVVVSGFRACGLMVAGVPLLAALASQTQPQLKHSWVVRVLILALRGSLRRWCQPEGLWESLAVCWDPQV